MGKKRKVKKRFSALSLLVLILSFGIVFFGNPIVAGAKIKLSFGKLNSELVESISTNPSIDYDRSVIFASSPQGIVKCEQNSFILYDPSGQAVWEKEINAPSPMVRFGESFIIIGDYGTGEIYNLSLNGEINGSAQGFGKLKDIRVGENGVIAVVLAQDSEVVLMNEKLEEITRISLPKGELMDFDLSANKSLVAFSFINMDQSNFYSNVLLYSLDGRLIGATNFEEQYIFGIKVIEDNIVGVLDNEIFVLNSDNELIQTTAIDRRIESFYLDEAGLVFLNLTKNPEDLTDTRPDNVIEIMSLDGKEAMPDIVIDTTVDQMVVNADYLTFLSGDKIYQLDKSSGELLKIQTLEKDALKLHTMDRTYFGVEYIDKFDIYSLDH